MISPQHEHKFQRIKRRERPGLAPPSRLPIWIWIFVALAIGGIVAVPYLKAAHGATVIDQIKPTKIKPTKIKPTPIKPKCSTVKC